MKFILTLIIFIISLNVHALDQCEKYLDDCEYYSCVNLEKNCGNHSYFGGFGQKYCLKFLDKSDHFSSMGQLWIANVKSCLIDKIHELDSDKSCKQFKKHTIAHHVPCYIESGYCSLPSKDKRKIARMVIKSMWRPSLVKSALKVLNSCRKN